ncbi:hypothetical protein [Actinacidiphila soli]|uniref:hypothetical protein n=1 Tax=Actinacidiphila soli TaxID=2487275 RepID=UPI000FCB95F9|nr:hypothetical protein [Actinacidiphila soli]
MDDAEAGTHEVWPELCDSCAAVIYDGTEVHAVVPDSSVIHATDAHQDGKRLLTACCAEHLAELQDEYRRRPFVAEEQWAGKVGRALDAHPTGISVDEMLEDTGLTSEQVDRGLAWNNDRLRRRRDHG